MILDAKSCKDLTLLSLNFQVIRKRLHLLSCVGDYDDDGDDDACMKRTMMKTK